MTVNPKVFPNALVRSDGVTALLGPTNTGKTHLAIDRLLAHESGAIGLPLRLLAREVYNRVAARAGPQQVALVTGEEKIIPPAPRYWVATVEAMPRDLAVAFVAIDEIQLAGDLERGHIFTDRLLGMRGTQETLLLGSATAQGLVERLLPGVKVVRRPRLSQLAYAGAQKVTRLPRRSAVVAFSAEEVYTVAEVIRRQRGGAAVVMGALSPRTRNAQVALFQNGDVDFLVATDAIGMGLNLDVDHVAFAQARKFDGYQYRDLTPAELAQIAGRAGRYLNDGTFGVTGQVQNFDKALVQRIESHDFEPLKVFQWRNTALDFSSLQALQRSLDALPPREGLTRALPADDTRALDYALRAGNLVESVRHADDVELLWNVCQIPDFLKISPAQHGDLVLTIFDFLRRKGAIPEEWLARNIAACERMEGDIAALSGKLAEIRTWTFIANRATWLVDPFHWQMRARAIEDQLSDALHERLTQRFIDRRTSVLLKRLRENAMLETEITESGAVLVEGQHVGELHGFQFIPDRSASSETPEGKALRMAAAKVLTGEFDKRAESLSKAGNDDFVLASDGVLRWLGQPVARLAASEDPLSPRLILMSDEQLTGPAREKVETRLGLWIFAHIGTLLKPLIELKHAGDLEGIASGIAFRLVEQFGIVERQAVAEEIKALDQTARGHLRKYGVRFGAFHIYLPALLKPAPAALIVQLWELKNAFLDKTVQADLIHVCASGRTSIRRDPAIDPSFYRLVGFRVVGERAVRIDILERLADIIRPLLAWKPVTGTAPPEGAFPGGGAFMVTVAMTSLLGCAGDDFRSVLKALGYRMEKRTIKVPTAPPPPSASGETEEEAGITAHSTPDGAAEGGDLPEEKTEESMAAAPPISEEPQSDAGRDGAPIEAPSDEERAKEGEEAQEKASILAEETVLEEREVEIWRPGRLNPQRYDLTRYKKPAPSSSRSSAIPDARQEQETAPLAKQEEKKVAPRIYHIPSPPPLAERKREGKQAPPSAPVRRERAEKPINLDSPFAALLTLKADLEKKQKKS